MPASTVNLGVTRQLSCAKNSVFMNKPCAEGWAFDSWYRVTCPSSAFAYPIFVFPGLEPSVSKVKLPLNEEDRCAGRVVRSMKRPVFMLWAPFSFVRLPVMVKGALKPKKPKRCSYPNDGMVPFRPPPKLACGSRLSGFALG